MKLRKRTTDAEEGNWALSYADVILNMFVFFVLLVALAPEDEKKEIRPQIELSNDNQLMKEILPRIQDVLGLDQVDRGGGEPTKEETPAISVSKNEGDYSRGTSKDDGKGNGFRADTNSQYDGTGDLPSGDVGGEKLTEMPGTAAGEEGKDGVDLIRKLPRPLIDSVMDGGDQWETELAGNEHNIMINLGPNIYAPGDSHVNKNIALILARVVKAIKPYQDVVRITIIGHSDSSRIKRPKKGIPDNRVLSFYRAYQAVEYLKTARVPGESLDALAADSYGRDTRSLSIRIDKRTGIKGSQK